MSSFVHAFLADTRVQIIFLLIALDLGLGVLASIKKKDFRMSYLSDFLLNDVLPKVAGFAIFYAGYKYAKSQDIVIPGVDFEVLMNGAWVIVLAALAGSLLGSIKDLGLSGLPDAIAGPDPRTPMGPAPPE